MSTIKQDLQLFNQIVERLLKDDLDNPVAARIPVEELKQKLDISLVDEPLAVEDFKKSLEELVLATPKTATNRFFNQLFGGKQSKAIIGDLLAVILNNSMYTYKVAGPQVAIEKEIITTVNKMIDYGPSSGGTFPTGGSMSNYMAMIMARDAADETTRNRGVNQQLIAYSSIESHYSNAKNASFSGIGRDNVRYIAADPQTGEMLPGKLKEQIELDIASGLKPFYVNATAGTTVLGAYDPINAIAAICEVHNLWLHVDGAFGGGAFFSEKYKHLLEGVNRADSFSFNAHKMLGTPMTCSVILVKDKRHLYHSFSNDAEYLYQTDSDDYNLGKSSFQCGRRNDALKFWTLWKAVGTKGLSNIVDHQFYLADIARQYIRKHPDYTLYSNDDSIAICFNYKNIDANELCTSLYEKGDLMVGFGQFKEDEFVRLITINANNSKEDILNFFTVLEAHVEKYF